MLVGPTGHSFSSVTCELFANVFGLQSLSARGDSVVAVHGARDGACTKAKRVRCVCVCVCVCVLGGG